MMFLYAINSLGQDSTSHKTIYPGGISIAYGLSKYGVRDEYVSMEKYSGNLHCLNFSWARIHDKYVYYLGLEYYNSSQVNNHNVSTDIDQFSLNQGFLYPLSKISLFQKDIYAFLGPSSELYIFYNKPRIAVSGFDHAQSFAILSSLGIHSKFIMPICNGLQAESSLGLSILSFGLRMVDQEEENESPTKSLTFLSGTNAFFKLGIRYFIFVKLSVKIRYDVNMTRITSWEPLLSASDNLVLVFTLNF